MSDDKLPPLDKVIAACKIGYKYNTADLAAATWLERQQAEIDRLREARFNAIEECARICENGEWVVYANQHSPTKSCALAIRDLALNKGIQ